MAEGEYSQIDGERLREIRMSRGLTLRRLEQHSGVSYERLNELELGGGVADGDTIEMLAEALDVEPSELLTDDA
ncbi:MAG: helix-turn-helix domain-containing protein [Actinomycetota bacterium]|nr:helix-turn-helix domain-containing protein [Actinomycetota bacterium]